MMVKIYPTTGDKIMASIKGIAAAVFGIIILIAGINTIGDDLVIGGAFLLFALLLIGYGVSTIGVWSAGVEINENELILNGKTVSISDILKAEFTYSWKGKGLVANKAPQLNPQEHGKNLSTSVFYTADGSISFSPGSFSTNQKIEINGSFLQMIQSAGIEFEGKQVVTT